MELLEENKTQIAAYKPFYAQLQELEDNNSKITFDYESAKGNKEARSHVYKLRQSKAALEKTRKDEKAESLRIGKVIDTEAKEIEARIEAMIAVHQVKIDEIEKREADRIEAISERIESIVLYVPMLESINSTDLKTGIAELEVMPIDDSYQEFINDAAKAKDARLIKLREVLATIIERENAAAELEKLREEAAARAQKDHDDAIAAKAIADAEAKAKAEREAAERRELQLKLDAENAERRRLESEQKAKQDAIDAAAKAEQDKLDALAAERKRIADAEAKLAAEQAERDANKAHKAKINRAALAAMVEGGLSEECAKQCIGLIVRGAIPNITIRY